jgi:hypothetical protein
LYFELSTGTLLGGVLGLVLGLVLELVDLRWNLVLGLVLELNALDLCCTYLCLDLLVLEFGASPSEQSP